MSVDVVVAGGGSNIVSLLAALLELRRQRDIARVAGTSAGGLAALALAFGVDEHRLWRVLELALTSNYLLDADVIAVIALQARFGLCRGDRLRSTARALIGEGARMGDAKTPVAVVVGDLYTRRPRVLSSWATPNVMVEDAAAATAAIPGVFCAQEIRGLDVGNRLHVDGGVAVNFGMDLFDDDPRPTLGIRPKEASAERIRPVRDLKSYLFALAALRQWAPDNAHASNKPGHGVVDVPAEDGLDFALTPADFARRRETGTLAMRAALAGGAG